MELSLNIQGKRFELLKTLNLIALITTIAYVPFYAMVGNYYYIPIQCMTAGAVALNFYFLKRRWLDIVSFYLPVVLISSILYASRVTPKVGTELLLIPIAIVLLPTFRKIWHASLMFVLIVISYMAMEYWKMHLEGIVSYSSIITSIVYQSNIAVVFIVSFLIVFYFHKSNLKYGHELHKTTETLIDEKERSHQLEIDKRQRDLESQQLNEQVKLSLLKEISKKMKSLSKGKDFQKSFEAYSLELNAKIASLQKAKLLQSDVGEGTNDFDDKLSLKFPLLSKAEKELCVYIKLKMSNAEIAELRNTSPNTINVMKYRMKKKIGVESTNELDELILRL